MSCQEKLKMQNILYVFKKCSLFEV